MIDGTHKILMEWQRIGGRTYEQITWGGEGHQMIVAVDFDGTLTRTDDYPEAQPNYIGFHAILKFKKRGGKVILLTCRAGEELEYAVDFCRTFGLTFDAVNSNLPEMEQKWLQSGHTVSPKVFADVYEIRQVKLC